MPSLSVNKGLIRMFELLLCRNLQERNKAPGVFDAQINYCFVCFHEYFQFAYFL